MKFQVIHDINLWIPIPRSAKSMIALNAVEESVLGLCTQH
jgi:hypothetical protein